MTAWGASGRSPHCRILLRSCRDVELLLMVALLAEGRSWGPASWRRPKHLAQSCHSPVHCLRLSFPMGRIWRDIREQHSALPLQVAGGISLDFSHSVPPGSSSPAGSARHYCAFSARHPGLSVYAPSTWEFRTHSSHAWFALLPCLHRWSLLVLLVLIQGLKYKVGRPHGIFS